MKALVLLLALLAVPAAAQDHSHHGQAEPASGQPDEPGNDSAPPIPTDHAADRMFPRDRMDRARSELLREGQFRTATVRIDRLEYRAVNGRDGYAWEAETWTGGDIDRFGIATDGAGELGHRPETVQARALWRHTLDPWYNLELGVRHDFRPSPQRTFAVVGISGLAPYWIEVEGQLLISDKGDVHARLEAEHDMRITQDLILQPAAELDFAFQDVPELGIGGGTEKIELGARLRYHLSRQFAPYVGVHWEKKLGDTADRARAEGDSTSGVSLLFGVRSWF